LTTFTSDRFSPIVAASDCTASWTVVEPSGAAFAASRSLAPEAATASTIWLPSPTNSAFLATKSVSAANWMRIPSLPTTMPLVASRSVRLAALASPEIRSSSMAFS
jgi:hypothetical protein